MPRGVADLFQVVVFSASTHAFLHCRRAAASSGRTLLAEEHLLELHHPGIGEHDRRVVAGHYWRTRMHYMPLLLEVLGESFADFCCVHTRKYTPAFDLHPCMWSARASSSAASSLTRCEPRSRR